MNRITYDISIGCGVMLASAGAWLHWDAGVGLMVMGSMVIMLTLIGAALFSSRR